MKKLVFMLFAIILVNNSFAQEKFTIKANISNRNGDVLFVKNNNTIVKEIKVDGSGYFNSTFDIKEGMYQLYDGKEYTDVYLKNGFNLSLTLDAKNFDESILYNGTGAAENNYLAKKVLESSDSNFEELLVLTPEEFTKKINEKQTADIAVLEKGKYDPSFIALQKKAMGMELFQMKMEFKNKQAQLKLNNAPSPTFNYVNIDGKKTKLEDLRGKYVYIDVWATWCGPCRGEIPFLAKVEEKYKEKNIAFVSISVDEDKDFDKWKKFVSDKQLGGIQLFADKNWNSEFITAFGINSIPRFILIDPKGVVVNSDADRPSDPKLQEKLDSLLN
jgi:thiol-disulfide isomerase/thioredoxin